MKALILVDIQNDFTPTGTLPVPEGEQVMPVVNKIMDKFELVVATQDWHPPDHKSFAIHHNKNPGEIIMLNGIVQILWPVHCVQGAVGAEFATAIEHQRHCKGLSKRHGSRSG